MSKRSPRLTIEESAASEELELAVRARPSGVTCAPEYYAKFERVEVKEGAGLVGLVGDGATPQEAVEGYASAISGRLLVFGAMRPDRREITAPHLRVGQKYDLESVLRDEDMLSQPESRSPSSRVPTPGL